MDDLPIEEILLIARKYGVTSVRVFGSRARGDAGPTSDLDPSEAHRKIEVVASDALRFVPAAIDVSVGEVVTFGVRNDGDNAHEFVLGDDNYQASHEVDMAGGDHMMDTDNAVSVGPGETKQVTWRFTNPGEVMFGCHEPGHYDGGMVGTTSVN